MKTTMTTALLLLLMITSIKAQINIQETTVQPPQMKSNTMGQESNQNLCEHLTNNIEYPQTAIDMLKQGMVKIAFTVQKNGQLTKFKVIRSVSYDCDHEVISAIKGTTNCWLPGRINHQPVDMETTVTVLFELEGTPTNKEIAKSFYLKGIRRFYHAQNPLYSETKINRKLTASIRSLNNGLKYLPDEHCILTVKSLVHSSLGDTSKQMQIIEKLLATYEPNNVGEAAMVTIHASNH